MSPQAVGSGVVTLGFFLFLEVVLQKVKKKPFLPKKKLKWQVIIRNDVSWEHIALTFLVSFKIIFRESKKIFHLKIPNKNNLNINNA